MLRTLIIEIGPVYRGVLRRKNKHWHDVPWLIVDLLEICWHDKD